MIHQYGAQRFRRGPLVRGREPQRGTIPVGTIVYLQDGITPFGTRRWFTPVFRNPWQVVAWKNREYYPCVKGKLPVTYMTGGHLAVVRSLRDGRVQTVADWLLLACIDAGG